MNVAIFLERGDGSTGPSCHSGQPQSRRASRGTRTRHDELSAVTLDHDTIARAVAKGGIVAPQGARGVDDPLPRLPGARVDVEPVAMERVAVYLSLCACSNHIGRFKRPSTSPSDFTPIVTLPDDCLLRPYEVDLPWKDGNPGIRAENWCRRPVS